MKFSDDELEALVKGIYSGKITQYKLPKNLYTAIADYLKSNMYKGFGISFDKLSKDIKKGAAGAFTEKDLELLTELRENVYMFSAAKTFNQVKSFRGALVNDEGNIKPFKEFKADMLELNKKYNVDWLEAEYNTAYGQAQIAAQWNQIESQADIFPFVRYSAVMDRNTSDICRPLDGITLPVNHPFWNTHAPLNHFNCRCVLEQLDNVRPTGEKLVNAIVKEVDPVMSDVFKMNPGKDKYIFKKDHPYFEVDKKDKPFAKKNFGLEIPATDGKR